MHEIMNATYELLDELDKSDIIKNILFYKDKIKHNKKLINLIEKGKKNIDDKYLIMDIKRKLYLNNDYKKYIDNYNKLFYIIMNINNYYKRLLNNRNCSR